MMSLNSKSPKNHFNPNISIVKGPQKNSFDWSFYLLVIKRRLLWWGIVALFQWVGAKHTVVSAHLMIFPLLGLVVCLLFLRGFSLWPGVLFGGLIASIHANLNLASQALLFFNIGLAPLILYQLYLKYAGPMIPFVRARDFIRFVKLSLLSSVPLGVLLTLLLQPSRAFTILSALQSMLSILLGLLLLVPFGIISTSVKNTFNLNLKDKKLGLLFMMCGFIFCLCSDLYLILGAFVGSLGLLFIIENRLGQKGVCFAGMFLGALFMQLPALPCFHALSQCSPYAIVLTQTALALCFTLGFAKATLRRQQYFSRFSETGVFREPDGDQEAVNG